MNTLFHDRQNIQYRIKSNRSLLPCSCIIGIIFLILAYPSWVRGGTMSGYQPPMVWLAWLGLFLLILTPMFENISLYQKLSAVRNRIVSLLKDPFFYISLFFLLELFIQMWNARWTSLSMEESKIWMFGVPKIKWLPSSITAEEGKEMLYWFFPAFTAVLCVRHGLSSRHHIRLLYWLLILNAAVLSIFGIVQFISCTHSIYWRQPMSLSTYFFASFGYANHAGAFFTLVFCLGLALIVYYASWRTKVTTFSHRVRGIWTYRVLGPAVLLIFAGAQFSLSRTSILFSLVAFILFMVAIWKIAIVRFSKYIRLYILISVLALVILGLLFMNIYIGKKVKAQFTHTSTKDMYGLVSKGRLHQAKAATLIWRDNPWFGVGGWGYRYYVGFYLNKDILQEFRTQGIGIANVHNDILQFLAEFGGIGLCLLMISVIILIAPVISNRMWRREIIWFPLLGAGAILAHSLIDLPFRSPAILNTWFVIIAASNKYSESLARILHKER